MPGGGRTSTIRIVGVDEQRLHQHLRHVIAQVVGCEVQEIAEVSKNGRVSGRVSGGRRPESAYLLRLVSTFFQHFQLA